MKIKRRLEGPKAEVPGSSMADIAFLLIIFFMVSTTYSKDKTTVDLASASEEQRVEIPKDAEIISIQKDGKITANNDPYEVYQLDGFVGGVIQSNPSSFFILKVDKSVPFQEVDKVLDVFRQTGAKYVCFPTNLDPPGALSDMGGS